MQHEEKKSQPWWGSPRYTMATGISSSVTFANLGLATSHVLAQSTGATVQADISDLGLDGSIQAAPVPWTLHARKMRIVRGYDSTAMRVVDRRQWIYRPILLRRQCRLTCMCAVLHLWYMSADRPWSTPKACHHTRLKAECQLMSMCLNSSFTPERGNT